MCVCDPLHQLRMRDMLRSVMDCGTLTGRSEIRSPGALSCACACRARAGITKRRAQSFVHAHLLCVVGRCLF
jgi:hypothetical protein